MAGVPTLAPMPDVGFEFTVVDLDPLRAAVRAVGELDLAARDGLAAVLDQQDAAQRQIIHLDLSEVSFIDASCLGVLVGAHHRLLERNGLLVLTDVAASMARVLKITGLDNVLFIIPRDEDPFGSFVMAQASRPSRNATPHGSLPGQRDLTRACRDQAEQPRARGQQ